MSRKNSGTLVTNRETKRQYLDAEIGRVAMGEPRRSRRLVAKAIGVSEVAVFYGERRIFRKVGVMLRRLGD